MYEMLLTQYSGKFLGPIAKLLGYLMNGIYLAWDKLFNVQNIGLCIITFTVIIYVCLLPLTIKQQKFTRLNQIMQPELKKIQDKYRGRKDSASQAAMQEETQAIYDKYGVSPTGSCLQLVIQIPILWSLYRVIYNVPAYVPSIKAKFTDAVNAIMSTDGYAAKLTTILDNHKISGLKPDFTGTTEDSANYIIDILYKLSSKGWDALRESFSGIADVLDKMYASIQTFNTFLGINISESPLNLIKTGYSDGTYLVIFLAILVPVLSALTQLLNIKLTQVNTVNTADAMSNQMKTMTYIMPIFSFIMVFSLPVGVGIYWIAGACIRTVLQLLINVRLNKIDFDKIVEANKEKAAAKAKKRKERRGVYENQIRNSASMSTKKIVAKTSNSSNGSTKGSESNTYINNARPGSLASKANMVSDFNNNKERNVTPPKSENNGKKKKKK